jgi:hypothetical protein
MAWSRRCGNYRLAVATIKYGRLGIVVPPQRDEAGRVSAGAPGCRGRFEGVTQLAVRRSTPAISHLMHPWRWPQGSPLFHEFLLP